MSADIIAKALGGGRIGSGWMACCPAHNDRNPSLSIQDADDGKVLVYCHAGCDQARVIAALQARGLEVNYRPHRRLIRSHPRCSAKDQPNRNDIKRTEAALRIWRSARPATGTLVEAYLRSRGISIALPLTVRFHAELNHPSGTIWPAMVTLVTRGTDDVPLAIHRTFLARGGEGKAPIEPQKMMLGPCRGARYGSPYPAVC